MKSENRRSFVKKSLATSVSISFTGLIRAAHGETVTTIPDTTAPWEDTTAITEPWDGSNVSTAIDITIDLSGATDFTLPNQTTIDPWSMWNPVTQPCAHSWQNFFLIRHVGDSCWPVRHCELCGIEEVQPGITSKFCRCLRPASQCETCSSGETQPGQTCHCLEWKADCQWFSYRNQRQGQ